MPCNTVIEPACRVAGNVIRSVTSSAAGDVLGGIAQAITAGVRWIVENTATWWLRIPSPNLAAEHRRGGHRWSDRGRGADGTHPARQPTDRRHQRAPHGRRREHAGGHGHD